MKKNNIIIVLLINLVILLGVGLVVTAQQPVKKTIVVMNNTTPNNTTGDNTTVEKISNNDDNIQTQNTANEKQDTLRESDMYRAYVQDAQKSREKGGQCKDMSDEQIEEMVYNEMMYGRG